MVTWAYGRCPTCRRQFSILANGQIHAHMVTENRVNYGVTSRWRGPCPGGMAIRITPLVYESQVCAMCGQIVRTDGTGKPVEHKAASGRKRCPGEATEKAKAAHDS